MDAQAEMASTVKFHSGGDSSCWSFRWTIDNFSKLNVKKLYSDIFCAGEHKCRKWRRILIFPKGNRVDYFSMYLDVADSETLPSGWSKDIQFSLSVINQMHSKNTIKRDSQHVFNARESDWGFTSFIDLCELNDPSRGFILNDTCILEAEVRLNGPEESEARLYITIKVACDEDLISQIGRDIYFDLVDHDKVRSFRIKKEMPFYQFKEKVAKEFGIPVHCQRFWLWAKRQNHTYRPLKPLTLSDERRPVGGLRKIPKKGNGTELNLFLEVELDSYMRPVAPPEKTKEDILLFFKLYDPLKEELRYVGRLFAKSRGKPIEILTKLNKMAGFGDDEEIELFEEIKFEPSVMCEPISKEITFRTSQLEDGDIICFQKSQSGTSEWYRYPIVPAFLKYIHKRQTVEAQQEQSKPPDSQAGIPDAHEIELPPTSMNVSTQQVLPSAKIEEQSEQELVLEKTRVCTQAEHDPFSSHEQAEPVLESEELETLKMEDTQEESKMEPTVVEAEKSFSSLAELDVLLSDIQNLLNGKSTSFQPPQLTDDEIANAKETFRQCVDMKLSNVIELGRAPEFKNSICIMLNVNAFPNDMVHKMTKFLANFDRIRELYVSAQQDLREAKEKQNSVGELKTNLKELFLEFIPIRNRANEVDEEVAKLERQLAERKEEKAQLRNSLEDLAGRASASRRALINAEQEMKLFMHKKEEAEGIVADIERLWESLKN